DGCLRRGLPDARYEETELELRPRFSAAGKECDGFTVICSNSRGENFERQFSLDAFDHLAAAAAQDLIAKGVLDKTTYAYDVRAVKRSGHQAPAGGISLSATIKTKPIEYLVRPLAPLVAAASKVGGIDSDAFPVFYTEAAFQKTERLARQGA